MNKKSILVVIAILLFIIICGYLTGKNDSSTDEYLSGKYNIEIKIKDYGTIDATLDADVAPITVTNFVDLVKSGYYTGLKFHRIIDGFMMQGGAGNSRNTIKGEFSSNGITNNISHVRGTISRLSESFPPQQVHKSPSPLAIYHLQQPYSQYQLFLKLFLHNQLP